MNGLPRLLMTGATGNTGLHTLRRLRARQPQRPVLALVRPTTNTAALRELGVPWHVCDLDDPATYLGEVRPGDVLLETANLRHARRMLPALVGVGVTRAFCVTTTGVFSRHHSYSALYREIEEEMRRSPLEVTILRPSMIYGNERDHNMHKLLRLIARVPVYPVFGTGRALMQPVHVEDLAEGIAQAVVRDARGEFNLAGPGALSYRQIVDEAFRAVGRRGVMLFVPMGPMAAVVGVLQRVPGFPVKHEQVIRLQEDKAFEISPARRELGYAPRPFALGIAQEVARLRQVGRL
ncbi:NAD-dependent epimerase/dehydratase family protein [Deinococcus sp. YIM 134068]|uniref:NAD-dependent epimerase/dehydratase family protein n=1 Tax=Deinococcus lichenicola TaxID=3118910 RepID=UPI002F950E49